MELQQILYVLLILGLVKLYDILKFLYYRFRELFWFAYRFIRR